MWRIICRSAHIHPMTDIGKDEAALERAVVKIAKAAERLGLAPDDLIKLLDSGMSVEQVFEYIMAKQAGRAVDN
jgi:hypothetical protein